jgi:hypothetical protein
MTALIDTGFMLAVLSSSDLHHYDCRAVLNREPNPILPSIILPELAYLTIRGLGHPTFIKFMRGVLDNPRQLVTATDTDLSRATDLMEKYLDARIDLVDCVIVAMAERLNISRILTVDQRDFRILRPNHIPAFEILP